MSGEWCKVTKLGMLYKIALHFGGLLMCLLHVEVLVECVCAVVYEPYGIRTALLQIRIPHGRKRGATYPHPVVSLGEWGDRG